MFKPGRIIRGKRKYKIKKYMESGGFSKLYLGLNLHTNRHIVVKVLRNDKFDDLEEEEDYFRRERAFIDIQSKSGSHALRLVDSIVIKKDWKNSKFILITNYINGEDFDPWLHDIIEKKGDRVYYYLVKYIFYPLCEYFSYCHNHGLLHRDFSPSNILIKKYKKKKPVPVVIDFGASLNFDPAKIYRVPPYLEDLEDSEESYVYTEGYNPPEVDEDKVFLPQSDIYCFGAVMFYSFSLGKEREEDEDYTEYELNTQKYNIDCPDELDAIVSKCTQYEPRERYLSFDHLMIDLKAFIDKYKPKRKSSSKKNRKKNSKKKI
ncbi:MAG: protein kinase [Candidatus Lokiarchaeota archaeon]|nr:protein kinase [Candidatus Lokiarchaeota archaeon]